MLAGQAIAFAVQLRSLELIRLSVFLCQFEPSADLGVAGGGALTHIRPVFPFSVRLSAPPDRDGRPRKRSAMSAETLSFQAEVSRLLDIVANSLYSHKEIFLRELISNASDACDRLRYAAIAKPELIADDPDFRIRISAEKTARRLIIADNGIGMNRDELIENLGTIAQSGTAAFVAQLEEDKADVTQIGQFGVGFYSAFMVAEQVEVTSRKAGEDTVWCWRSDGKGSFEVEESDGELARGTVIALTLKKGEEGFLAPEEIRRVVTTYSDHIAIPIVLEETGDATGDETGGGAPIWLAISTASSTLLAASSRTSSKLTASGSWAIQRRARRRPRWSRSITGPQTVCSTSMDSSPAPLTRKTSRWRANGTGPSTVR